MLVYGFEQIVFLIRKHQHQFNCTEMNPDIEHTLDWKPGSKEFLKRRPLARLAQTTIHDIPKNDIFGRFITFEWP